MALVQRMVQQLESRGAHLATQLRTRGLTPASCAQTKAHRPMAPKQVLSPAQVRLPISAGNTMALRSRMDGEIARRFLSTMSTRSEPRPKPGQKTVVIIGRGPAADQTSFAARAQGHFVVQVCSRDDKPVGYANRVVPLSGTGTAAYMNTKEIIEIAKSVKADMVHPGWGLLSENPAAFLEFEQAGLNMVGPSSDAMAKLGSKASAMRCAKEAGVPVVPSSEVLLDVEAAVAFANTTVYPINIVSVAGGGGRGQKMVENEAQLRACFPEVRAQAQSLFGNPDVFLKKFLIDTPERPLQHIEVQILMDKEGNALDLGPYNYKLTRNCTLQDNGQKIAEEGPADPAQKEIWNRMVADSIRLAKLGGYTGAATVEFLFDQATGNYYFLEVNTRLQVENGVTAQVTGIDIPAAQYKIAMGQTIAHIFPPHIGEGPDRFAAQVRINGKRVKKRGEAVGTVPNPQERFPLVIPPRHVTVVGAPTGVPQAFDSTVALVIAAGDSRDSALDQLTTSLTEGYFPGTSVDLAIAAIEDGRFRAGTHGVGALNRWMQEPSFQETIQEPRNRWDQAYKLAKYAADVTVNGPPPSLGVVNPLPACIPRLPQPDLSSLKGIAPQKSYGQTWTEGGASAVVARWKQEAKEGKIHLQDNSLRDGPQTTQANRVVHSDTMMATEFLNAIAHTTAAPAAVEVGGGANTHVQLRFLREDPFGNTKDLQEAMTHVITSALMRAASTVAYGDTSPDLTTVDEVYMRMVKEGGIRKLRIFHAFNDVSRIGETELRQLEQAVCAGAKTGAILELCAVFHPDHTTQDYVHIFQRLHAAATLHGAQDRVMFCIKDAQGRIGTDNYGPLEEVVAGVASAIGKPPENVLFSLHTHNSRQTSAEVYRHLAEKGFSFFDFCRDPRVANGTQPGLGQVVGTLRQEGRTLPDLGAWGGLNAYDEAMMARYAPFMPKDSLTPHLAAVVGLPPGMMSNVFVQYEAVIKDRIPDPGIRKEKFQWFLALYKIVLDDLFHVTGVTPASKDAGEVALALLLKDPYYLSTTDSPLATLNRLDSDPLFRAEFRDRVLTCMVNDVLNSPPASLLAMGKGHKGRPPFHYHPTLQAAFSARGLVPETVIPLAPEEGPARFEATLRRDMDLLRTEFLRRIDPSLCVLGHVFSPKEIRDYYAHQDEFGVIPPGLETSLFGIPVGTEREYSWAGRTLVIKTLSVGPIDATGHRLVLMEIDGHPCSQRVKDRRVSSTQPASLKGSVRILDTPTEHEETTPMPGQLITLHVKSGDTVKAGQILGILEAMKMQTPLIARRDGVVTLAEGIKVHQDLPAKALVCTVH